jgi:hypothetical protein
MHKHIHMSIRSQYGVILILQSNPAILIEQMLGEVSTLPHPINPCMDPPHLLIRRCAVASDGDADVADAATSDVQVTSQAHTAPPALSPPATLPPSRLHARARPVRRPLLETRLLPCRLFTPHPYTALALLPLSSQTAPSFPPQYSS